MALRARIGDEQTSSLGGWLFADLFLLIMVVGLAGFNITASPGAPRVITGEARSISKGAAQLTGIVDSGDKTSTAFFRWGTDASLDGDARVTNAKESPVQAKSEGEDVSAELSGLLSNTKYFFQLQAESSAGSDKGEIRSFKTTEGGPCSTAPSFIPEPFEKEYTKSSAGKFLLRDINNWVTERKFVEPQVAVAMVRGWTTNRAGTEGSTRARVFFNTVLRKVDTIHFNANTALEALQNQDNPRGVFSVRLFFVEVAETCKQ